MSTPTTARLLIACPDAQGIVASVTNVLARRGANVIDLEQHADTERAEFTMRVEFEPRVGDDGLRDAIDGLARERGFEHRLSIGPITKRLALLAGPSSHCLADMLWRCTTGDIDAQIVGVISNHDTHRALVEHHGIPYHHHPVPPASTASDDRAAHEDSVMRTLKDLAPDAVVLARYMRVLSPAFARAWERRMINIHHSFLPAFIGADPYRQAHERGVKIIGATAHFVTEDLDEGPIIAQGVTPVTHHDTVVTLKRKGRDLERTVLADAVRKWVEEKILVRSNRTVVFR